MKGQALVFAVLALACLLFEINCVASEAELTQFVSAMWGGQW